MLIIFLFFIYFRYLKYIKSDIEKERDELLADFRLIKYLLVISGEEKIIMGSKKVNIRERVKEIVREEDTEVENKILKYVREFCPFSCPNTLE